jgi:hypothetical protein
VAKDDDFLSEKIRAEDILLGALGFAEDARIVSIQRTKLGYRGLGRYSSDGHEFEFDCDEELDELQEWALGIVEERLRLEV